MSENHDQQRLGELLHELGAQIDVPPGDATADLHRGRRRLRHRRLAGVAAASAAVVVVGGIGLAAGVVGDDPRAAVPADGTPTASDPAGPETPVPAPRGPESPTQPSGPSEFGPEHVPEEELPEEVDESYPYKQRVRVLHSDGTSSWAWVRNDPQPCASLAPGVPGATEVGAVRVGPTTVRVYANEREYATCDEWTSLDGGPATLLAPQPVGGEPTEAMFRIGSSFTSTQSEYVAGGLLPEGVTGIRYTFSDGHSVAATIHGGAWAMAYLPETQLPDGATATVEVTTASGVRTFELAAGAPDFCAQVNHGC